MTDDSDDDDSGGEFDGDGAGRSVFQTIVCEMDDAVFLIDVETTGEGCEFTYRRTNAAHQRLTGIPLADIRGKTPRELVGDELGGVLAANYRRCVEAGEAIEYEESPLLPGGRRDWLTKLTPVTDGGEVTGIVGVARDITEERQRALAVESSRERLRRIIDLVPDPVFVTGPDGECLLANEAAARVYGTTPAEIEGQTRSTVAPEIDAFAEYWEGEAVAAESAETGEETVTTVDGEETVTTVDGETRVYQTTGIPYPVSTGDGDGVLCYARDVTARREYELAVEQQRDNLKLLNQVVRHDIRNQLNVVEAYTDLLEDSVGDDRGRTYVRTVIGAARQATSITETAKEVTDVLLQVGAERSAVGLRPALDGEVARLREDEGRVRVSVDGRIPDVSVLADDLLGSVFRNLLTNAVVHNDKEIAEITVAVRVSEERVRVSFADNGPGIADEHKAQIFEEGEKGLESGGTGVGLYLVKTLVDRYGGDVRVEDNDPTGSVFVVELVRAD